LLVLRRLPEPQVDPAAAQGSPPPGVRRPAQVQKALAGGRPPRGAPLPRRAQRAQRTPASHRLDRAAVEEEPSRRRAGRLERPVWRCGVPQPAEPRLRVEAAPLVRDLVLCQGRASARVVAERLGW